MVGVLEGEVGRELAGSTRWWWTRDAQTFSTKVWASPVSRSSAVDGQDASPSVVSAASPSVPSAYRVAVGPVGRRPAIGAVGVPAVGAVGRPRRRCRRRHCRPPAAPRGSWHVVVVEWLFGCSSVPPCRWVMGRLHRGTRRDWRTRGSVQAEQPPAPGDRRGLGSARGAELAQDVGDMHRDRLGADEQLLADLAVGAALSDQRDDLGLAGGQVCAAPSGRRRRCASAARAAARRRARGRPPEPGRPTSRAAAGRLPPAGCRPRWPGPPRARRRGRTRRTAARPRATSRPVRPGRRVGARQPAGPQPLGIESLHPGPTFGSPVAGRVGVLLQHGVALRVQPLDLGQDAARSAAGAVASDRPPRRRSPPRVGSGR